jgi:hypothetical protein
VSRAMIVPSPGASCVDVRGRYVFSPALLLRMLGTIAAKGKRIYTCDRHIAVMYPGAVSTNCQSHCLLSSLGM